MTISFKVIILANAILLSSYLFVNLGEYSILSINSNVDKATVQTFFPFYILVTRFNVGFQSILFFNYPLIIFLATIAVNLYFIIKLQRNEETKPN